MVWGGLVCFVVVWGVSTVRIYSSFISALTAHTCLEFRVERILWCPMVSCGRIMSIVEQKHGYWIIHHVGDRNPTS